MAAKKRNQEMNMKTGKTNYYKTINEALKGICAELCENADILPEDLFPATVYIEDEGKDGYPKYERYALIGINKNGTAVIVGMDGTREEISLESISADWLITLYDSYISLCK